MPGEDPVSHQNALRPQQEVKFYRSRWGTPIGISDTQRTLRWDDPWDQRLI